MSLAVRQIEESGIPTVMIGSARDIVEEVGVPRFVFVDYPLGNPCGKPYDLASQSAIADTALNLLEKAFAPRTTVQAPVVWDENDDGWRDRFMQVDDNNRADLAAEGARRRQIQAEIRADGAGTSDRQG